MSHSALDCVSSSNTAVSIYDYTIEIHRKNIEESFLENIDHIIDERLTILKECGIASNPNSYKEICRELEFLFKRAADTYIIM